MGKGGGGGASPGSKPASQGKGIWCWNFPAWSSGQGAGGGINHSCLKHITGTGRGEPKPSHLLSGCLLPWPQFKGPLLVLTCASQV